MSINEPVLRKMEIRDIEQISEIEKECFTLPWSEAAFYNELVNNHFARYMVLEAEGDIIAYGGMWNIMDEAHVTNIAVRTAYRGQGYGELMLRSLMAKAALLGSLRMTLEVRVSNTVAQRLYAKLGFVGSGVRKGYYSDNGEDALIMWAELDAVGQKEEGAQ